MSVTSFRRSMSVPSGGESNQQDLAVLFLEDLCSVCKNLYKKPENKTKETQRDSLKMTSQEKHTFTIPSITEIKMTDKLRRSGKPAYNHPHRVERYLYKMGFEIEYAIVALFHDILEDTPFNDQSIKRILNIVLKKYPSLFDYINEKCIDEIIDAIKILTKKDDFPKCYNVLYLETTDGEQVAIENFWGDIKIRIIDKDGNNTYNLIKEEEIKPRLSEENFAKFQDYKIKMNQYKKDMSSYIEDICKSPIAMVVKIADRIDNLREIAETDKAEWIEKYTLETIWILNMLNKLEEDKKLDKEKIKCLKKDLHEALRNAENIRKERSFTSK